MSSNSVRATSNLGIRSPVFIRSLIIHIVGVHSMECLAFLSDRGLGLLGLLAKAGDTATIKQFLILHDGLFIFYRVEIK